MKKKYLKVGLLHQNTLITCGVRALLSRCDDIEIVQLKSHAKDSYRFAGVDVLIGDYDSACAFTRQLRGDSHYPVTAPRVLVLTGKEREHEIREALNLGVHGYLLEDCQPEALESCIRTLAAGQRYISEMATMRLAASLTMEPLTARERDVLTLIVAGLGNKGIATNLGISVGTIKSHVASILAKLRAETRTEAAFIAFNRGLVLEKTAA